MSPKDDMNPLDEMFSISYEALPGGALRFTVATVERGTLLVMELSGPEALWNLQTFAKTLGYKIDVHQIAAVEE